MSKVVVDRLRADEKFVIPFYLYLIVTLYQRPQAIPGFDRGLIELMRRALCDIFAASNFVWISYGD